MNQFLRISICTVLIAQTGFILLDALACGGPSNRVIKMKKMMLSGSTFIDLRIEMEDRGILQIKDEDGLPTLAILMQQLTKSFFPKDKNGMRNYVKLSDVKSKPIDKET